MKLLKGSIFIYMIVLLASLSAHSADEEDYPTEPRNSVKIVSISPTNKVPLSADQKVTFDIEIQYKLGSADTAKISVHAQNAESQHIPVFNEFDVVFKGKGTTKISKTILVPKTRALEINVSLMLEGMNRTGLVDSRFYKVVTK